MSPDVSNKKHAIDCAAKNISIVGAEYKSCEVDWESQTKPLRKLRYMRFEDLVEALALSHGANVLAAGGWNGKVVIWNTMTGIVLFRTDLMNPIRLLSFSRSGERLLVGSWNSGIRLWRTFEADERKILPEWTEFTFRGSDILSTSRTSVWSVAWEPNEKGFLFGDDDGSVQFWSPEKEPRFILKGHNQPGTDRNSCFTKSVPVVALSHCPTNGSNVFATGSWDCNVRIWKYEWSCVA